MPRGTKRTTRRSYLLPSLNTAIGYVVREERIISGLTQAQLGKSLAMPHQNIANLEHGKRGISLIFAMELCHALSVDLEDFMRKVDDRFRINELKRKHERLAERNRLNGSKSTGKRPQGVISETT